jgi:hypothetical protein
VCVPRIGSSCRTCRKHLLFLLRSRFLFSLSRASHILSLTQLAPPPSRLTFLSGQVLILMAGMVFLSGGFGEGSPGFNGLTALVSIIVIASTVTFIVFVCFEVYRSLRCVCCAAFS